MNDLGIIDQFLQTFSTYIDSGFGLLAPDIAFLTTALVTIDIVLAGLFWAFGNLDNIVVGFLKKVLYIGFFALLLNQFPLLANIIFESFAQLGLNATGGTITAADLLRPGFVASTGFTAAHPLLDEIADLSGPVAFFVNIVTIAILALAWLITLFAFFFLAIQIFVTIIEFKLTTLAGFVLVPFALWNKTSFLAERVLGNVISSGIKLMVLAIIVGIGSTLFGNVTSGFTPGNITLEDAAAVILASLALLALGIFGPAIATGLVSGAPQLGAGAAVGTAVGAGAAGFAAASVGGAAASAASRGAVGASGQGGIKGAASGLGAVAQAGAGSVANAAKSAVAKVTDPVKQSFKSGSRGAISATGGKISGGESSSSSANPTNGQPDWAKKATRNQLQRDAGLAATSTLRDGDRGGSGDGPRLKQDEE
jgi:type IV secretion system protein TrbL